MIVESGTKEENAFKYIKFKLDTLEDFLETEGSSHLEYVKAIKQEVEDLRNYLGVKDLKVIVS